MMPDGCISKPVDPAVAELARGAREVRQRLRLSPQPVLW